MIKLQLTPKFVLTFLALVFVMHEAHEIVHTSVGRIICGCWGQRDFNVWGVCEGCGERNPLAIVATFAGPAFTFLMIWLGAYLIRPDKTINQKAMGLSLIFANLPFARILTAMTGGGDEVWGLNSLLQSRQLAWVVGLLLIIAITIIPLISAYKIIGNKRRISWFLLFLLVPILIDGLVVLLVMNNLLQKGVLDDYWILGSPMLVSVWTIAVVALFLVTKKNIYQLSATPVVS